jgi:hypothetical protein
VPPVKITLGEAVIMSNTTTYRWIMYAHQPLGGFDVFRVESIEHAKRALERYGRDTFVYEQATATLYPYTEEDWVEAEDFRETGCPFDYPSKVIERGPKGGMKVVNA